MALKPILAAILMAFSLISFSQQCSSDSLLLFPSGDISYQGSGFSDPADLPCATSGSYSEIVIPFAAYNGGARFLTAADSSTVPVSKVYDVRIDGVAALPSGMCWAVRSASGNSSAALIIKGTASATSAEYPLDVTLSISTQSGGTFNYTSLHPANYKALLGQAVVRVADANGNCPSAN